jgi:hypothetical protein
VLSLQLFDCEFVDGDLFWTYGVPENSAIVFSEQLDVVSVIQVKCGSLIRNFRFTALDTIQELNFALRWDRGKESVPFALRNSTGFLGDGELLSKVGSSLIELIEIFQFRSDDESVSLPMQGNMTLRDAGVTLAEHFKIPQKQIVFLVNGCVIDDLSTRIWSYGNSIDFSHRKCFQKFVFDGRSLGLLVDFDVPFCELLSLLSLNFNISAPISIFSSNSQVDLDMTLTDLDSDEPLEIRLSATPDPVMPSAPPVISPPSSPTAPYSITLLVDIIPRIGTYQLAPTATLEEAEAALKKRLNLGDLELEFGLLDLQSDETTIIPKSTMIGQLDLKKFSLIARPSETFEPPVDTVSVHEDDDHPASENAADGGSLHLTIGGAPPSSKGYDFFCDSLNQTVHLRLPPGATVKQAREAVATHYGKPPEAVFLHFLGKELQDGFVMDRLRLGTKPINIYFRDDRQVLLRSARSKV